MNRSNPKRKIPLWRFVVPLMVQVAIVLSIPAQKVLTITNGTTVYLQTAPIDPYDVLRGRYVTLNYDIAQRSRLETLSGWSEDWSYDTLTLYVVLEPPADGRSREPWQPISVSATYPDILEAEQQVIKGRWQRGRLDLGLGAYYIPEAIGDPLEDDIRDNPTKTRAEVKVDKHGKTALISLWVEDRNY